MSLPPGKEVSFRGRVGRLVGIFMFAAISRGWVDGFLWDSVYVLLLGCSCGTFLFFRCMCVFGRGNETFWRPLDTPFCLKMVMHKLLGCCQGIAGCVHFYQASDRGVCGSDKKKLGFSQIVGAGRGRRLVVSDVGDQMQLGAVDGSG